MFKKLSFFIPVFILLILLVFFFWISDLILSVWDKLSQQPRWFIAFYIGITVLLFSSLAIFLYRWFFAHKIDIFETKAQKDEKPKNIAIEEIEQRLDSFEQYSDEARDYKIQLEQLRADEQKKNIRLVLFGDISTGKSALINALLPSQQGEISVTGGTTTTICTYQWQSPLGEQIILTDTPGFNEQGGTLDDMAKEAVYQAHLAIYLCEGDLSASQFEQIREIALLDKPLIVAFNKTDRYSKQDLILIRDELQHKLSKIRDNLLLVLIQSGGTREVTLLLPDNTEKIEIRPIKPQLDELLKAIAQILQQHSLSQLETTRQQAVLHWLTQQIDQTEQRMREQQANEIIRDSVKKAVMAAMATITPGADLLVQGYLASNMIKKLCDLYQQPFQQVDIDQLLKILQQNTKNVFPLLLGIAGNGFKAFPGVGTVAGGLLHAVAYGLIFDSVGKAVQLSLQSNNELNPLLIEDIYKEKLVESVESRTRALVKMVISQAKTGKHHGDSRQN